MTSDPSASSSASIAPVAAAAASQPEGSSAGQRRVQIVGDLPPQGPAIPKDDTHSDEDGDLDDDASVSSDDEAHLHGHSHANGNGTTNGQEEQQEVNLLANFREGDENLDLAHLNLKTSDIRKLELGRFSSHLKSICLRQNLITKISDKDLGQLSNAEDIDLYDNSLEKTYGDVFRGCPNLESLDFSFNTIRHISNIAHLARLKTIYFVQNKISRVREEDFDGPIAQSLTSLELGGNKLRQIENLERLTKLEELWLGKNKIPKLENLSALSSLRILSIQSNRITVLENLDLLTNLEELYISHNGLKEISGLSALKKLRVLDVGGNMIEEVKGLEGLTELQEFWANDNRIASLGSLESQLGPKKCPKLETVYLEGNPVQRSEGSAYRRKITLMLPQIMQLDATYVKQPSLR